MGEIRGGRRNSEENKDDGERESMEEIGERGGGKSLW